MSIANKFRSAFRGDVSFFTLVREVLRRRRAAARHSVERRDLDRIAITPARLASCFQSLSPDALLQHFRRKPHAFFTLEQIGERSTRLFPEETQKLIADADRIVDESTWDLAGFGPLEFKGENVWRRDPLGTKDWGLDYHANVVVYPDDKADIRVLWELSRFGHALTLACAFAVKSDERYAEAFFSQVHAWVEQNPYGRGANWNCAMETALRAMNLLAAFDILRLSAACTEERLAMMLKLFDQHGRFTLDNNEFSYLATSNHYLSDVVGLFWIGTMLPELEQAGKWREFGLSEMIREMDVQILPDGADFEASTGYHSFVTQMLLFTFILAKKSGTDLPGTWGQKLRSMLRYIRGITRPDGRTPLIGDADGSQVAPIVKRDSDDTAYLLAIGTVMFDEPRSRGAGDPTPEMLWLLGGEAVEKYNSLAVDEAATSLAFPNAGAYVMRHEDLYLHLNTNDAGVNGRGSHAHNDALSIEVAALGRPFLVDPGSYVYNLDREARGRFRSTFYHSTVSVDGAEQNTMRDDMPFILGNESRPVVREWQTGEDRDVVSAEHFGYTRLPQPVVHRRTVELNKRERYWLITDELSGSGSHRLMFSFHLAPGISPTVIGGTAVSLFDGEGRGLMITAGGIDVAAETVAAFASRNYGHRESASIVRWNVFAELPFSASFTLGPVGPNETANERLLLLSRVADNMKS